MRRSIVLTAVITTALWAAAGIAWANLPDDDTTMRPVFEPMPTTTAPTWTPPVVLVDRGVEVDQEDAQAFVARVAADPRGWRTSLDHLTIRIVKPGTGPTQGLGGLVGWAYLDQDVALITADAWTTLGPELAALGGTLDDQRTQLVNHEIGHLLRGDAVHQECASTGPAPVMRSWTYRVGGCDLNVWPNPGYDGP